MGVASGAMLSFSLGPVQPFIASARTVRDLWTGSYLLSWLTFAAMRPVLDALGEKAFVRPSLKETPLYRWAYGKETVPVEELLVPCLPNRFLVSVPDAKQGTELAVACEKTCRDAWQILHQRVFKELKTLEPKLDPLKLWDDQLSQLFEIRTVVMPRAELKPEVCQALFDEPKTGWRLEFDLLGGLLDATRSVKHVPVYPIPEQIVPQKCSLLGTYEQVGPAELEQAKTFWKNFADSGNKRGSKTTARERLCALSLVKRFAWAQYFSRTQPFPDDVRELRFADTATAAAEPWLNEANFDRNYIERSDWSGQWLHWHRPDQDREEVCPPNVWGAILSARARSRSKPPKYYAILMLDGDRMGRIMGNAGDEERSREYSRTLTAFALSVRKTVVAHGGYLIYAGGDDVLAVLPARSALACARALEAAYREIWKGHQPTPAPTMSGGLVVAHYKEDLRYAMSEARAAEKEAKSSGRDALCLRVLRRSGEHSSAVLGWDQTAPLDALVDQFADGFGDRWAYKLRATLPSLAVADSAAVSRFQSELRRLLDRVEAGGGDLEMVRKQTLDLLDKFQSWTQTRERNRDNAWPIPRVLTGFVTLCQSASFLARGREEGS